LSGKPKILLVADSPKVVERLLGPAADAFDLVVVQNPMRALAHLSREPFAAAFISSEYLQQAFE